MLTRSARGNCRSRPAIRSVGVQLRALGGMAGLGIEAAAARREAAAAAGLRTGTSDAVADVRVHRTGRMDGPDLVIEATGSSVGLRLALELVRDGGEVVLL